MTEREITATLQRLIKDYEPDIIAWRRHLHRHPELSFEEVETTKYIASQLEEMGIPYEINTEKNTGLIGWIDGGRPGKTVALRADIDALPVTEKTGFDFASENVGKMHACGHDAHMSILLGATKMLMAVKDQLPGRVYLVFQPSEETGEGGEYMKRFGTWYQEIDSIFGGHIWIDLPAGKISIEPGERMAAAIEFGVDVIGKQGHGAQPHLTVDATVVASAIVMNYQTIVSRGISPLDSVVVTVGKFMSGDRYNVISGKARLEGTVRYFKNDIGDWVKAKLQSIAEDTAKAYGAEAKVTIRQMVLPLINEPKSAALGAESVKKLLGEDHLATMTKTMAGEDFSSYLTDKPGAFGFFGIANPELGAIYSHHSDNFTIDESALAQGAGVYAQYAVDFLTQNENK